MEENLIEIIRRKRRQRLECDEFWKAVLSITAPGSAYKVSALLGAMMMLGWPQDASRDALARAGIEFSPSGGRRGRIAISIESIWRLLRQTAWAAKSPLQLQGLIDGSFCYGVPSDDEQSPVVFLGPFFFEVQAGHAVVRRDELD